MHFYTFRWKSGGAVLTFLLPQWMRITLTTKKFWRTLVMLMVLANQSSQCLSLWSCKWFLLLGKKKYYYSNYYSEDLFHHSVLAYLKFIYHALKFPFTLQTTMSSANIHTTFAQPIKFISLAPTFRTFGLIFIIQPSVKIKGNHSDIIHPCLTPTPIIKLTASYVHFPFYTLP